MSQIYNSKRRTVKRSGRKTGNASEYFSFFNTNSARVSRYPQKPTNKQWRITMIENDPTNVDAAFEILLEEIEAEIDFITDEGAKGFKKHDYERAKEALEHAPKLIDFRDKIASLRKRWETISLLL